MRKIEAGVEHGDAHGALTDLLRADISAAVGSTVQIRLTGPEEFGKLGMGELERQRQALDEQRRTLGQARDEARQQQREHADASHQLALAAQSGFAGATAGAGAATGAAGAGSSFCARAGPETAKVMAPATSRATAKNLFISVSNAARTICR